MKKQIKIEFTAKNIFLIVGICLALFLLWQLKVVVFIFIVAFIISSALRPLVEKLHSKGIPRIISIIIIYILFIIVIFLILYLTGVVVFKQVQFLTDNLNEILTKNVEKFFEIFPWARNLLGVSDTISIEEQIEQFLNEQLPTLIQGGVFSSSTTDVLISTIKNILGVITSFVSVIILSAYMLQKEDKFYVGLLQIFPNQKRKKIQSIIDKVEDKLGRWVLGQLFLMVLIGGGTYIGLMIPGIFFPENVFTQYAVPLALISGLLEVVPNIGPIITWIIAMLITIGSGGSILEITYIAAFFTAIQQLEIIFILPGVMKKVIGLDPVVIIISMIAAGTLFGMIGTILILPLIAVFQIVVEEVLKTRKEKT
jgi:predicted PurR-regulated permease PerM